MSGWILLHRQLKDSSLWLAEPFTRGQAWVDILMLANHEYGYFYIRGNRIDVQRGEVAVSEDSLASRWGWSKSKVRGFIKSLENDQQINQQKSPIINKICIINYDSYQKVNNRTTNRKTTESLQKNTNKEGTKNDKEVYIPVPSDFDDYVKKHNINANLEYEIERCIDYHTAKGTKVKCWKATIRTWLGNKKKWDEEKEQPKKHKERKANVITL